MQVFGSHNTKDKAKAAKAAKAKDKTKEKVKDHNKNIMKKKFLKVQVHV
jgi:hypothetical protein